MKGEIKVHAKLEDGPSLLNFAQDLKRIVVKENMSVDISGKKYVLVEAWQFVGGYLGVVPVVTELTDMSSDKTIKYRASVELRKLDGTVVGNGIAVCSNNERGKGGFADYAVASMAQTRATGKAYRLTFGWLVKMAGYEATPIEEMDGEQVDPATNDIELKDVADKIKQSKNN